METTTTERINALITKIDDYSEVMQQPLLKLWAAQLESNMSLLISEHREEVIKAEMQTLKDAHTSFMETLDELRNNDLTETLN